MLGGFARLGLDVERIRREAGVRESDLADPDGLLPSAALYAMWEVADRLWGRPGLGLSVAGRVPVGALEALDYLLSTGPTLGEGLTRLAEYFAVATRTARYEIHPRGGLVAYQIVWRIPPRGVMFQVRDYSLSAIAARAREASGRRPARVELAGPPLAKEAQYAAAFGAPVATRAGTNALLFAPDDWRAPLLRRDESLHRTLRRHADELLRRSEAAARETLAERVRAELLRATGVGLAPLGQIARGLGMGPRTLQRRLREEGEAFAALANGVRASLACEYLGDPGMSIGEVGYLLGFSEPSAFSRAFRHWTGKSPQAFRAGMRRREKPGERRTTS
jgi:AraC-like DNA-binding protein